MICSELYFYQELGSANLTFVWNVFQLALLEKYEKERLWANLPMMAVLDGFQRVFGTDFPLLNIARAGGFNAVQYIGPLKKRIISFAMGSWDDWRPDVGCSNAEEQLVEVILFFLSMTGQEACSGVNWSLIERYQWFKGDVIQTLKRCRRDGQEEHKEQDEDLVVGIETAPGRVRPQRRLTSTYPEIYCP